MIQLADKKKYSERTFYNVVMKFISQKKTNKLNQHEFKSMNYNFYKKKRHQINRYYFILKIA